MADITGGQGNGGDKGNLLGQNPLEEAAKDFSSAIDKLSKIYEDKIKPGVDTASNVAGAAKSVWTGKPATFSRQGNGQNGGGSSFTIKSYNGQGQVFSPTSQAGTLKSFPAPTMQNGGSGNGGSPNLPTKNPGQVAPGKSNAGGAAVKAAGVGATFKALANYGNTQLQTQLPMDQYVYQGSLGMPGNLQQNQGALRKQAFGANNQNLNAIATNQQDAAQMYSMAGQVAGTPLLNQTQSGRTVNQAMSVTGVLNPYMSGTQNAQVQSNIYNPTTSMNMMRQGLATPRQVGTGKPQQLTSLTDQWMKSFYGGRQPNMKELNAGLGEGGKVSMSLGAAGLSPGTISAVGNIARAKVQVQNHGGNWDQAEKLIDKARTGDTGAGEELQSKYGLDKSLVQGLKNKQAAKTGRDSDTSASFNKALSDATDTLQKFSKALTAVMNKTGITGALGTGGAWASQISGSVGGFGGAMSGIGGLYGTYAMGKMLAGKGTGALGGAAEGAGGSKLSALTNKLGLGGKSAGAAETGAAEAGTTGAASAVGPTGIVAALALPSIEKGKNTAINSAVKKQTGGKYSQNDTKQRPGESMKDYEKRMTDMINSGHNSSGDGRDGGDDSNGNSAANKSKTANKSQKAGTKGQRATGNASASKVITEAEKYIGTPYHYGGNSPKTNFDCSGLTQWSFKEAGMNIPRVAKDQQAAGKDVPKNQARAGDLIFKGNPATHVALMIDNKNLIEAPHTGATVRKRGYTPGEWTDARRLIGMVGDLKSNTASRQDSTNSLNERAGDAGDGDTGDSGSYGSANELTSLQDKLAGGPSSPLGGAYSSVSAYATGTKKAKKGVILTGERGAELVHTDDDGKTSVWNAKQTSDALNNSSPMQDMLMGAGLATARKSGTGNVVNLNFGDNAIVIQTGAQSTSTKSTTSKKVRSDIKQEDMYDAIASGKKN